MRNQFSFTIPFKIKILKKWELYPSNPVIMKKKTYLRYTLKQCCTVDTDHSLKDPVRSLVDPVRILVDPVRSLVDPVRSLVDPDRSLVDPVRTLVDPVRSLVDPNRSLVDPVPSPTRTQETESQKVFF